MKEEIALIVIAVSIKVIIDFLETKPNYTCPSYCEVNHEHYKEIVKEIKNIETNQFFRVDSISSNRLVEEY